jgi:hypothetical protein
MGGMAEGWLPPNAPGAKPPPRFDASPEQPPPAQPEPARSEPPRAQPTFVRTGAAGAGPRNAAAVSAVALGIAGLALLVLSLGTLFIVTLPCSIAAWALAGRARRQIESGATTHGDGQATAALWLGRIGVIAGVAALVVFVTLLAAGFDFEQFRDDLQRELDERQQREDGGDGDGARTSLGAWLPR